MVMLPTQIKDATSKNSWLAIKRHGFSSKKYRHLSPEILDCPTQNNDFTSKSANDLDKRSKCANDDASLANKHGRSWPADRIIKDFSNKPMAYRKI